MLSRTWNLYAEAASLEWSPRRIPASCPLIPGDQIKHQHRNVPVQLRHARDHPALEQHRFQGRKGDQADAAYLAHWLRLRLLASPWNEGI